MKYSFGDARDPQPNDPRFDSEDEAVAAALNYLETVTDEIILAVWAEWDGNAETRCLVYEDTVWTPA